MRVPGAIVESLPLPEEFGRWFALEELRDNREGFGVLLLAKNGRLAWVRFGEVLAYRVCEEGLNPALSAMLGAAPSGLVSIEGSSWVSEFAAAGPGRFLPGRFTHWCLGGSNHLIEVIADVAPTVEVLPADPRTNEVNAAAAEGP